jgi:hypothetical protein
VAPRPVDSGMHAGQDAGSLDLMAQLSYARFEPMFRDRSLNRGDIATDLAIPLLAEGGWPAMTLAAVAARGNMKRQSVAQWFGNVEATREMVAWQYTRRWLRLLSAQLTPLYRAREGRGARRGDGGATASAPGSRRHCLRPRLAGHLRRASRGPVPCALS